MIHTHTHTKTGKKKKASMAVYRQRQSYSYLVLANPWGWGWSWGLLCLAFECLIFYCLHSTWLNLRLKPNQELHLFHGIDCLSLHVLTSYHSLKPHKTCQTSKLSPFLHYVQIIIINGPTSQQSETRVWEFQFTWALLQKQWCWNAYHVTSISSLDPCCRKVALL